MNIYVAMIKLEDGWVTMPQTRYESQAKKDLEILMERYPHYIATRIAIY